MIRYLSLLATAFGALIVSAGCTRDTESGETMVAQPSSQLIEQAAAKRVVFAHQSVGNDILSGVAKLAADAHVPLAVFETRDPPNSQPGIYHFKVGENGAPDSKLDEFLATLTAQDFSGSDIALLKLCYIDFDERTDASRVASKYVKTLETLRTKYPNTRFIATTAPLTTIQVGPKAWIKKLLGKEPAGYATNAQRQVFNEAIRNAAQPSALFDIARIESSADGAPVRFEHNGKQIEALAPQLTYDGGHLNDKGKAIAASAFLELIAAPTSSTSEHPAAP